MSNRDNFAGGFFAGAIVGGIIGGIVGAVVTSARYSDPSLAEDAQFKQKKRPLKSPDGKNIEAARRGLEDKIAQLNDAIDDVRQKLGTINGHGQDEDSEQSLTRDS
ncbi:hypothetical protein BST81_05855 [Leptolyngbya sp. 'hensonii']|uniref:hypothetical protein n=1 Tax=Leptolyngbya sp. 'hensonii' TaxID=1922337 RepID=UPI00094F82FA|nr:hypothetical protein [Leptolyngbya sp. 'hensonii']OLP19281.1 hypothetical protein BST81_05855 [Leptolyngbya sp. 'hensonii']